jgi:hypothetical protein
MNGFAAHQLRFECEAVEPMEMYEWQGSGLRGALYRSLWGNFCMNRDAQECGSCPLVGTCPVAFLVATLDPNSERGVVVPRPYTIEPPPPGPRRLEPGQPFSFGLTMFARAMNLFPYVVLALERMGQAGLGRRMHENRNFRGRFRVQRVHAVNPLTGDARQVLRAGDSLVKVPDVPVTHGQVTVWTEAALANGLAGAGARLTVEFLTPTRIRDRFTGDGPNGLLMRPLLRPLFQRLLERLTALSKHFSDTPMTLDFGDLVRRAEGVRLAADQTHWLDLESQSRRQRHRYPSRGFVGTATYQVDDWPPFLPWLLWGQLIHVGKDAVKGNGQYRILL